MVVKKLGLLFWGLSFAPYQSIPHLSSFRLLFWRDQRLQPNHEDSGTITLWRRRSTMVKNRKKHRQNSHPIIHCPTSEGVSEVSERANEWAQRRARAKRAVWSKRTSERCERKSKWTSKWPSTTVCILGCYRHSGVVIWTVFLVNVDTWTGRQ